MIPIEQIHPMTVHFPIVFALSLVLFDGIATITRADITGRGAVANVSTGIAVCAGISAAIAFVFGDFAIEVALNMGFAQSALERHEALGHLGAAALVIWAIVRTIVWWRRQPVSNIAVIGILGIEVVVAILILITAYFGGQLVYEFGVGVRKQ